MTVKATFIEIPSRPFVTLDVDYTDGQDFSMLLEQYGDWSHIDEAVVRVRYRASEQDARYVDHSRISKALYDAGAHKVYAIQADVQRENRARVEGVDEELDPLTALNLWIGSQGITDPDLIAGLRDTTTRYLDVVRA
jgi:hypothetical protein